MNNLQNIEAWISRFLTPIIRRCVKESLMEIQFPTKPEKIDKLISIKEAAAFLNLAIPTIYTLTSKHSIPFRKRGKRLYFRQFELEEWLEKGKSKSVTELDDESGEYISRKEIENRKLL